MAEDEKQLAKFRAVDAARLASVKAFVAYAPGQPCAAVGATPGYTWAEFLALGKDVADAEVKSRSESVVPGPCCSLIYTSGTTGNPKAVMISHDSCTWTAKVAFGDVYKADKHEDRVVSYLPLSHIAGPGVGLDLRATEGTGSIPRRASSASPPLAVGATDR